MGHVTRTLQGASPRNSGRLSRRLSAVGLAAALLAGVAACGDDDAGSATTAGAAPTTSGEPVESTCVADVDSAIAAGTSEPSLEPLPADLVASLDAAVQASFAQASAPGAIVGVQTPEGTWTAAYGLADPDAGMPMEVGMHTRIGSVTKTFVNTLLLQLEEEGVLSLDDTIDEYVDGVPNGDRITLRMLADMTSGVQSYTLTQEFVEILFTRPETVWTPQEVLQIGLDASPLFEPGAEFYYSNSNTILIGMVIEQLTGQPVQDVLQERIFDPLGLDGTSWPGTSTDIPEPYAQGFTLQGMATPDNPSNTTHWNVEWAWTAGEMISTIDDLLLWGRSLATGRGILGDEAQAARLTSFPGESGYGLALGCVDEWVGHTGELPGYNTSLFHHVPTDTTVIVQANSDIASGDCPDALPTLPDNNPDLVCTSPATRIFVALSDALGYPFPPEIEAWLHGATG